METGTFKIFAVEDDTTFTKMLKYLLELDPEHEVDFFTSGKSLLDQLHKKPNLITLDYSLPDLDGTDLIKRIRQNGCDAPIIIISGQEDIGTAVSLLKLGAYDYICKDQELRERLLNAVQHVKRNNNLERTIETLRMEVEQKYDFDKILIGNSEAMRRIYSLLEKAAKTNITVTITGETGTGKEMVAKAIHYNSTGKNKPLVAINVAAIPEDLIESELFGYEKGAFTGAVARRIGKFEEANGGTLFLDEIAEMPLHLQSKLLRVLQEREVTRLGANMPVKVDFRLLVATHRNLAAEVKSGRFREDLYYRIAGLPISLPPLRERDNDAIVLAKFFLDKFSKENNMGSIKISNEAAAKIKRHSWPGNVRELKGNIELAAVMCSDQVIYPEDIVFNELTRNEELFTEDLTLEQYTYKIVRHFMNRYDNNVLAVAQKLEIGKSTIYRYLKEMEQVAV